MAKCRKFDLRQWVLVTDWNPLTVWLYSEPYVRFAGCDFDFDSIGNKFSHLSNNSIVSKMKNGKVSH
jgi:tubulin monoglycylase TTLL3/8